jgi:hypothetical protein
MDDAGSTVERVVELPGQGRAVVWDYRLEQCADDVTHRAGPLRGRAARRMPEDLFPQRYRRSERSRRWLGSLLNTPGGCV